MQSILQRCLKNTKHKNTPQISRISIEMMITSILSSLRMDAIKKKMEKLANETNEAEMRIAHFEDIKAANELEVNTINNLTNADSILNRLT